MVRSYKADLAGAFHIGNGSPSFVSNMRRLLQVKSARHYAMGYKTGAIASSRLYRVALPPIDGGDWNSRVFKKRTSEANIMNTAVMVLVDWSGSMTGQKSVAAAKASGLINEAFSRVLHVPLEIVAFTSMGPTPTLGIMKTFNERVSADEIARRFADFARCMSGNNDADVLQWGYHEILRRKEKRKVIIVLSDGSPADGFGDPHFALRSVASDIESRGLVNLYGLGIMDDNVAHFYKNHKVIWNISEIEPALVSLLGKALV